MPIFSCLGFFKEPGSFKSLPEDFYVSAEFQPANLGSRDEHVTPRPQKPVTESVIFINYLSILNADYEVDRSFVQVSLKQIVLTHASLHIVYIIGIEDVICLPREGLEDVLRNKKRMKAI